MRFQGNRPLWKLEIETCIVGVLTRHVLGHFATRTLTRKTSTGVGRSSSSCGTSLQLPRESLLSASSPPSIPRGSLPFARPTGLWWPAGWWLRGLRHAATAVRRSSFQLSWGPSTFLASSTPKTREPGTVENNTNLQGLTPTGWRFILWEHFK